MYYFKINDDFVIKYEVFINKKDLETLRKTIIDKYSNTRIIKVKKTSTINNNEQKYFGNHHLSYLKSKVYTDGSIMSYYIYHIHPYLANLISELLNDNFSSIYLINNLELDTTFNDNEKKDFIIYRKAIIECIQLIPVDIISIETLKHVNDFVEENNNLKINNALKDIITIQRKKLL